MPDEIKDDAVIENNDSQDVEVEDDKTKEKDFHSETIDYIKETKKEIQDTEVDDSELDSEIDTKADVFERMTELSGTDIPDEFSEAAEAAGMTERELIELANEHTNEELLELIPFLKEAIESETDTEIKDTKTDDVKEIDQETLDRIKKEITDELGVSLEEIKNLQQTQKNEQDKRNFDFAMKKIDEVAKEFPVLGKYEELPRFKGGKLDGILIPTDPAVKARKEILQYADAFMGIGQSIDEAMSNASATYKGLHLAKEVKRNFIKDLKNHETNLSGRRVAKETKKTYADSREEILDEIRQMQRASGVDV